MSAASTASAIAASPVATAHGVYCGFDGSASVACFARLVVAAAVSIASTISAASATVLSFVAARRVVRYDLDGAAFVARLTSISVLCGRCGQDQVCPDLVAREHAYAGDCECVARGCELAEHFLRYQRLCHEYAM